MDVNQKGKICELEILTYITKLGYSVSIPFGDKDKYDQIWDVRNKLLRVQIKTSRWRNDDHIAIRFNCYSMSNGDKHKYSKDDIDYFATWWDGKCYLIPVEECSTEKSIWFETPKNKCSGSVLAKDYEVEEVLRNI